jgi:(p)ppGpp synthase/HD superfamily hydrolase
VKITDLESAIIVATQAHRGVPDKQKKAYILHPLRVMLRVPEEAQIVAILHDVIEDTKVKLKDLQLDPHQEAALDGVTRRYDSKKKPLETYKEFIERIALLAGKAGRIARIVKLADLADNLGRLTPDLEEMAEKRYFPAQERLREAQEIFNEELLP